MDKSPAKAASRLWGILLALLTLSPLLALSRKPQGKKNMEWHGGYCEVSKPGERIVKTQEEWERLWKELGRPAPPADFSRQFAVAVFLGLKNTGGYGIRFLEPVSRPGETAIRYKVESPQGLATQSLTQPYAVKLLPKSSKPVKVEAE
ncbi:MAG: protease complex subunit PrcB family protein [Elusimicrobia bacterium]|nr:protease complex subunit PrcB family protein [Elusimicrobiota bacterium]